MCLTPQDTLTSKATLVQARAAQLTLRSLLYATREAIGIMEGLGFGAWDVGFGFTM